MGTSAFRGGFAEAPPLRSVTVDGETIVKGLFRAGLDPASTVVLVGSAARGVRTCCSDVDVLILSDDGKRVTLARPGETHLQQDTRSRFLRRLTNGDDYPAWALRLGVPLRDPDQWWAAQVAAEQTAPHWPDWHRKVDHASKRIRFASELLETGDLDAAAEELVLAASHVARAVLLGAGIFPLSRPELPDQLGAMDADLAALLRALVFDDPEAEGLKAGIRLLEARLAKLVAMHADSSRASVAAQ